MDAEFNWMTSLARFPIRKEGSFLLGDKDTDMAAAAKFGIPSAMVDASGPYNVVQQLLSQKDETLPMARA